MRLSPGLFTVFSVSAPALFLSGAVLPVLFLPGAALLVGALFILFHRILGGPWYRILWLGAGVLWTLNAIWEASHLRLREPVSIQSQEVGVRSCWPGQCLVVTADDRRWYLDRPREGADLVAGQRGQLSAQLEPWTLQPVALSGAFGTWLLRQQVEATGRVTAWHPYPLRGLARARRAWSERGLSQPAAGVYQALLAGNRARMDDRFAAGVARTQTQHLLALSGLHIGTLSLWAWYAAGLLWWFWPASTRPQTQRVAALVAGAGLLWFALPALSLQRAFLMAAVPGLLWLSGRRAALAPTLLWIACCMVWWDPLIWLDLGAWFSWWATLILVLGLRLWAGFALWQRLILLQLILGASLVPLHALWDLPLFAHGFWVNIVLVPWVTLVTLPLAFLVAAQVPGANLLFTGAIAIWQKVLALSEPVWALLVSWPAWTVVPALAAIMLLFILQPPIRVMWRLVLILALTAVLALTSPMPTAQGLRIRGWTGVTGSVWDIRSADQSLLWLQTPGWVSPGVRHPANRVLWSNPGWPWKMVLQQGPWPGYADPGGNRQVQHDCVDQVFRLGVYRLRSIALGQGPGCSLLITGAALNRPLLLPGRGDPAGWHARAGRVGLPSALLIWPSQGALKHRLRLRPYRTVTPVCKPVPGGFRQLEVNPDQLICSDAGHSLLPWLRI